jgi:hypothetical protein
MIEPDRLQMIRRVRLACLAKFSHTFGICNTQCSSTATVVTQTRLAVTFISTLSVLFKRGTGTVCSQNAPSEVKSTVNNISWRVFWVLGNFEVYMSGFILCTICSSPVTNMYPHFVKQYTTAYHMLVIADIKCDISPSHQRKKSECSYFSIPLNQSECPYFCKVWSCGPG